jgi:hypothetical protein
LSDFGCNRRRGRQPDLPVLLTSGYAAQRLPDLFADDQHLLRRPFALSDLSQALRRAIKPCRRS